MFATIRNLRIFPGGKQEEADKPASIELAPVKADIEFTTPDPSANRVENINEAGKKKTDKEAYRWIAGRMLAMYKRVMEESSLASLQDTVLAGMQSGAAIDTSYIAAMEGAKSEFVDAVRPHLKGIIDDRADIQAEVVEARKAVKKTADDIVVREYELNGKPGKTTGVYPWYYMIFAITITVATFAGVIVLETGLTSGILAYFTDPTTSQIMSISLGALISFFGALWGATGRILSSHKDTVKHNNIFMTKKISDRLINRLRQIDIWSPEEMVTNLYNTGKWGYILSSLGWLIVRIIAVINNKTANNFIGIVVACFVIVVGLIAKAVISMVVPKFGMDSFRLNKLYAANKRANRDLEKALAETPELPEEVINLGQHYKDRSDKIWHDTVLNPIRVIKQAIANAHFIGEKLAAFRNHISIEHLTQCANAFALIERSMVKAAAAGDAARAPQPVADMTFTKVQQAEATQELEFPRESEFMTAISAGTYVPERLAPARIIPQPNKLVEEMLEAIQPTPRDENSGEEPEIRVIMEQ